MQYILLFIAIIMAIIGLYRFFSVANRRQIISFFLCAVAFTIIVALFYMAVTGKLAAALGLFAALWPVGAAMWHNFRGMKKFSDSMGSSAKQNTEMNKKEALEILGLEGNPDPEEIVKAYKKLMAKVHPDNEDSKWMASKLNAAKEYLLNKPDN